MPIIKFYELRCPPLRKDFKIMGLAGSAHGASHFFYLILPPLFPILRLEFDVNYVGSGLLTTMFYRASGITKAIAVFWFNFALIKRD